MKNINYIAIAMIATALTACANSSQHTVEKSKLGMANPASKYCVEHGGKLEIKQSERGEQVGYCHLANGQVVEEWGNFRKIEAKCLPEQAQTIIGQSGLSDEKIKQMTQASIIRTIQPNQPVTMDYREDRITVTIDPQSKAILKASCG